MPHAAAGRRPPPPSPGFSRDRTFFDNRDEENPFVLKSLLIVLVISWRGILCVDMTRRWFDQLLTAMVTSPSTTSFELVSCSAVGHCARDLFSAIGALRRRFD
ncbi:hypothetical protein F511_12734 [Dorcoceras hygrometricum]|uniref:Uncharacterized protein n=1 Tax=Dorcoceras hygrometricum TaxID=472368 RepID=A0A2Z7AVW9_9LAMI|nr:hypothetical protein F511_12734 [Dorcoceras hygrometricum]